MGEALTTNASDMQSLSLESVRSRLRELSASLDDSLRSSDDSISQTKKLLKDLHHNLLVVAEDPSVASLEPDELEAYIEHLMKMINLEEEENLKVFEEFNTLESIILRDSTKLKGDLEAFSSLVDFIDSKGVFSTQTGTADDSSVSGSILGSSLHLSEDYKLEIFPTDVHLDDIIKAIESRCLIISKVEDTFQWLIRKVQQHIILCTLRHLMVKDANKSRGSCTYCDADKIITACIKGGVEALIKVNHGWPLSSYPLTLRSIEHADNLSKSISWSSLCKVKEQANSLDIPTRCNLTHFLDSIEQLSLEYSFI